MYAPAWSPSKSNLHRVPLILMLVKETTGRYNVIYFLSTNHVRLSKTKSVCAYQGLKHKMRVDLLRVYVLIPVVSFTKIKIQVTLCKLDFEGLQAGTHVFEKNYFHVAKILFETLPNLPLLS